MTDPEDVVPDEDRPERRPAIDEPPDRSPEVDEADQLEQAATLPDDDEEHPRDTTSGP